MSIRMKVLVFGTGLVIMAMLGMGLYMTRHSQLIYEEEVESKARAVLSALSSPCILALSGNHLEDVDLAIEQFRLRVSSDAHVQSIAVIDNHRRVVGHTDKSRYGSTSGDDFSQQAASTDAQLVKRKTDADGKWLLVSMPLITSFRSLPGIRWGTLVARLDMHDVTQRKETVLWHRIRVVAISALVTALLFFLIVNSVFVRPLERLVEAANALRKGQFGTRVQVGQKGELATLGKALNSMAEELENHTTSLHKLVDDKTSELQQANLTLTSTMEKLTTANKQLEELARTDGLTGLWNHRQLHELLRFQFALARRGSRPLSFAMIDVDNFKHYNDTHGHPEGDRILRSLSSIIRERIRQTDVACRYGGEEFAVLLPDTSLEGAAEVAEYLRRRVEEFAFPHEETQPGGQLTISIGVAEVTDLLTDPLELVKRADEALYEAKRKGRNRVHVARTGSPDNGNSPKEKTDV
jgi:diguanylate cyclase (GGDEF)-like protein